MTDDLNGLRLLVVEDEFLVALAVEEALRSFGCDVVGPIPILDDAVHAARSETLDGAVLDVNLGGTAIFPVADELIKRDVPFIFTTGYEGTALPERYRDRPCLQKPYRPDDLQEAIGRLVNR